MNFTNYNDPRMPYFRFELGVNKKNCHPLFSAPKTINHYTNKKHNADSRETNLDQWQRELRGFWTYHLRFRAERM